MSARLRLIVDSSGVATVVFIMSKTLFWYVFRDLFRIFFMAAGALSGIMSFGGLLRPLTEHGLDSTQVSKMLTYFTPAMMTYSFPVAALFAATMVYGRLSADNELTACRAGGISFLSMTTPAIVLGLSVALVSLLFLCFLVPVFTLKAEQVIYSNLSQLVQNQIERTHQIDLDKYTVYAQGAKVLEADPNLPSAQRVELIAPMIVTYNILNPKGGAARLVVATEFYMAKRAVAYIDQKEGDAQLTVILEHASRFQRTTASTRPGDTQAIGLTVAHQTFGPVSMPSPIKEDPKFMTIDGLKSQYENPESSRRMQEVLQQIIKEDQAKLYLDKIRQGLHDNGFFKMDAGDEIVTLTRGDLEPDLRASENTLVLQSKPQVEAPQVKLTFADRRGNVRTVREAMEMRVRAIPRWEIGDAGTEPSMDVSIEGFDVVIQTEAERARHTKFGPSIVSLAMPVEIASVRKNSVSHYLNSKVISADAMEKLSKERGKLLGKLQAEIHSRASFAISCLVLVMVGCALGMLFQTSNFLTAFAVSFVPAMFSVALIVTGQQICSHARNSAALGLTFIWGGNALVLLLACGLIAKLQRT